MSSKSWTILDCVGCLRMPLVVPPVSESWSPRKAPGLLEGLTQSGFLQERPDVQPETRHFNCILRAEAIWRGVRHAKMTVDDMIEGKYGLDIRPDIQSMNALLEVTQPYQLTQLERHRARRMHFARFKGTCVPSHNLTEKRAEDGASSELAKSKLPGTNNCLQ